MRLFFYYNTVRKVVRMKKTWLFILNFPLTGWMFPYYCRDCGNKLVKLTDKEVEARTTPDNAYFMILLSSYLYRCPTNCVGDGREYIVR